MDATLGGDAAETQPGARLRAAIERFGLHSDDPFDRLLDRLAAVARAAASAPRRAAAAALICWGGLLVLTLLEGSAFGEGGFLLDAAAFARFALAAPLLVLMDRRVDAQLRRYLGHFVEAPLLAPRAMPQAAEAIARAIDRARGAVPAAICLGLTVAVIAGWAQFGPALSPPWMLAGAEGTQTRPALSLAGWWTLLVSAPLFWFLMLRALWRYVVWALLLRRLASFELRLVATHPDGAGGLGFLGRHPNVFAALVFAMGVAVSGSVAQGLRTGALSTEIYGWLLTGWVAIAIALFAAPLSAFAAPLSELRVRARFAAAALATRRQRGEERKLLGRNLVAPDPVEAETAEDAPDAAKLDEAARKMQTIPFSRAALLPLAAAALLPLLAAGATRLPFGELVKAAKKLLLL